MDILREYSWACLFGLCVQAELVYVHMYKIATVWEYGSLLNYSTSNLVMDCFKIIEQFNKSGERSIMDVSLMSSAIKLLLQYKRCPFVYSVMLHSISIFLVEFSQFSRNGQT